MRFSLNQTSARSFALSLPDTDGRARLLEFAGITELSGALEILPTAVTLQSASLREAHLAAVDWYIPRGRIVASMPVVITAVQVEGAIPTGDQRTLPLEGRASVGVLEANTVQLEGLGPVTLGARIEDLAVDQSGASGTASVGLLALRDVQAIAGDFLIRLGAISVTNLGARWTNARDYEVHARGLTAAKLVAASRHIEVTLEQVEVPEGLTATGERIHVGAVHAGKVTVRVDVAKLRARREASNVSTAAQPEAVAPRGASSPAGSLPVDLHLLDRVNGQFDVDVTTDVTVPVLGRRKATHHFRVPINNGIFNYRQLERGLASLEDAVIDFDVRGHKLVVERDLPIIRLRKNLVEWHLDPEEMALAQQRLVRLRTLPQFEIVSSSNGGDLNLHGVQLSDLDIKLSLSAKSPPAEMTHRGPDDSANNATDSNTGNDTGSDNGDPCTASGDRGDDADDQIGATQANHADEVQQSRAMNIIAPGTVASGAVVSGTIEVDPDRVATGDGASSPATGDSAGSAEIDDGTASAAQAGAKPAQELFADIGIGALRMTGALCYPDGKGVLTVTIQDLIASCCALQLAGRPLDIGAVSIDSIESAQITFDGINPGEVTATLCGVHFKDVTFVRGPGEPPAVDESQ